MAVRAKFTCTSKVTQEWRGGDKTVTVHFMPVMGGSPENEAFFKATPAGGLELGGLKQEVADQFEPGKDYYLDLNVSINA